MMKSKLNVVCCLLAGLSLASNVTGSPAADGEQKAKKEYRFIASSDAGKLEKALNDTAKEGFRLEFLSDTFADSNVGVLMARPAEAVSQNQQTATAQQQFEYKALGAKKVSTLRKELDEAAAQGYELRGLTARASIFMFTVSETVAVLERPAGQTRQKYEYRFLTANREDTMQKALEASVSEGFHPEAMSVNRDNNAASIVFGLPVLRYDLILRRSAENPASEMATREYRFVSTMKPSTMEKEINQLATEGFRCRMVALVGVALMSRELKGKPGSRYEYKLLATRRTGTLAKELAEAGRDGFNYRGASGLVAFMERDREAQTSAPHDYKFIAAMRAKTTRRELDEIVAAGYEAIDLASLGEYIIILDRVTGGP